jgi:drug/metabolite transporter (DMT)-like permease
MGCALTAYSLLAAQDATVKWLLTTTSVWQVLFMRSAIIVVACAICGGRPLIAQALTTPTKRLLVWRGAVALAAWVCYFSATRGLPLGQVVTLYSTAPLIAALLAAPLLRENVSWGCWTAIAVGFTGTVLAADPSGFSFSLLTCMAIIAAVLWGYGIVLMRKIAAREASMLQLFFNNCFFLFATGIGCALAWEPLAIADSLLLLQVSALAGLGQFCLFESARHAPVSLTAPLEYTSLVWAFAFGFLIWDDIPTTRTLLGAGLILISGIGLLLSRRLKPRIAVAAPSPLDRRT